MFDTRRFSEWVSPKELCHDWISGHFVVGDAVLGFGPRVDPNVLPKLPIEICAVGPIAMDVTIVTPIELPRPLLGHSHPHHLQHSCFPSL